MDTIPSFSVVLELILTNYYPLEVVYSSEEDVFFTPELEFYYYPLEVVYSSDEEVFFFSLELSPDSFYILVTLPLATSPPKSSPPKI